MTGFWILAGLLLLAACAWLARALLRGRARTEIARRRLNIEVYREQMRDLDRELASGALGAEAHAKARSELEARLLEDTAAADLPEAPVRPARAATAVVMAFVALGAVTVYVTVGTPEALDREWMARGGGHQIDREQLEAMVERLAERLQSSPEDPVGWVTLARSYALFGRFRESADAYAQAFSRMQPDAGLLADYADVVAMTQGRRLAGEPEKLIARALELDPIHPKALALAGSAAFERNDFARAVSYWERMLAHLPPDSEDARMVRASIAEARAAGGLAAASAPHEGVRVAAKGGVSGWVSLAPELADKVKPDDAVFIYARAAEGSRMPLAIVRKRAGELPAAFTLDDESAMVAGMGLSQQQKVIIAARVSKSATATAQPGDFEGESTPVRNNASGVKVVIDSEVR
jgi:cytochrome c-type biogenesis protein CcmH